MNKVLVFLQQWLLCFGGGFAGIKKLKINGFLFFFEGGVTFLMNVDH